jgi:CHAT domain-containing protein
MTTRDTGRLWAWLAIAVIAAVLLAGSVTVLVRRWPALQLMRSAADARWRPVMGRLTAFPYAPFPKGARVLATTIDDEIPGLRSVAATILIHADRDPAMSAAAALLLRRSEQATRGFEALIAREPGNADHWSDLAAARLEVGVVSNDARAIARALAAADHALALDAMHAEALFNRALALDELGLRFAAVTAWQRYLAVDSGSAWAAEARERLAVASAPTREEAWKAASVQLDRAIDAGSTETVEAIVARFPLHARLAVESTYLPAWGNAFVAGDMVNARRFLTRARQTAAALRKFNGDGLLDQVIHSIDTAGASSVEHTGRGWVAYGKGRDDNVLRKITESLHHFEEAEREFAIAHNVMELSAAYFRANALVDLGDAEHAEQIASRVEQRLEPAHRSLKAHLLWLRARLTNDAGHHYESLVVTRAAREAFEHLGELDYAERLRTAEAAMLARLGRDDEAWQQRRLALAGAAASGRANLIEPAIEAVAREEVDGPDGDVARSLFNVQIAAPSALPLMRFTSLLWRAYLDARATGSRPDVTEAQQAAGRIRDVKQRTDARDELHLAEGMALRESDPAAAEQKLSEVLEYRSRVGLWTYVPAVYLQRARLRRKMSRDVDAEQDLRAAIELIEARRGRIRDDSLRDAFLGSAGDAYSELGDLLLDRGDWVGAFEISERERARVLLDHAGRKPMSLSEIAAATPPDVIGVHYTTLTSRTLIVMIEHARATHVVVNVGRSEMNSDRERLFSALEKEDAAEVTRLRTRFYERLIAPVRGRVAPDRLLVIAPDEATYGIPYATLRAAGGRSLIEETALAIAPAGAAFATAVPSLPMRTSSVTIVADPAFSITLFPDLERLPAARDDARAMQNLFGRTTTLTGEKATRSALAQAAATSDAVHIGAHAFASARDASLSLIVLAPAGSDQGALTVHDIESLDLHRHPVVVLAGCQTGAFGGGKGSNRSFAHAFLTAGSSAVLATLWNVRDDRASELTENFYRNVAAGETLPVALREAQITAIRTRQGYDWAAFQLHMGVTPRRETSEARTSH